MMRHPPTPQNFALLATLAGAVAAFALWRFLVRLRRDRLVGDTPTARIRSAAQGYVKVNGRALPEGAAACAAPLTGRPCVWWAFEIAREERDGRGNTRWQTIEHASSVELFVLEDDGARCLVGPVRAEVTPSVHNVWYGALARPVGPPPPQNPRLHSGAYRYTERLLSVDTHLCVMGELRSHSETGDAQAAALAKLHEWKQNQQQLLRRFDADHDGMLSPAEWDAARAAAQSEAQSEALGAPIERISVISEPSNGEPFLIAPLSDAQLERRERLFAMLYFVLGLVSVTVCAWAIGKT
jgi:E3 Ubiquitin ligase